MLTDLVDRDNGLVDGVVDCGHGSSSIGNSIGGSRDNGMGSNNSGSIGSSWGSNNSSGVRSYSSISSSKTSVSSSKTSVSQSSKTRVSSEASISGTKKLGISISSRGSKGGSHEGRQRDEGSHSDLC